MMIMPDTDGAVNKKSIDILHDYCYDQRVETSYLQERITAVKNLIVAYEAAFTAVLLNGEKSYTVDTGQTRTTVTKHNISEMRLAYTALLDLLRTLEAQLYGSAGQGIPGW